MLKDYFQVGHFRKTIGYKGELLMIIDADEPGKYSKLESLFVEQHGQAVPFFVEHMHMRDGQSASIKLQDVDDEEGARALSGAGIFLPLSLLPELPPDRFYLHEVAGYTFTDEHTGMQGRINQVIGQAPNPLFEIEIEGKHVLVPVIRELITKVDKENKYISMKVPPGLIELYLDGEEGPAASS